MESINRLFNRIKSLFVNHILKRKWMYVILGLSLVVGGLIIGLNFRKVHNNKASVAIEYVKAFKAVTTRVYYTGVYKDSIEGEVIVKPIKAIAELYYNLENVKIEGNSLILPPCEIRIERDSKMYEGSKTIVGKYSHVGLDSIMHKEDCFIKKQMIEGGYIKSSYETIEKMLIAFLKGIDCENFKISSTETKIQ